MPNTNLEVLQNSVGTEFVECPNCSKMYLLKNDKGEEQEVPGKCRRCECPMDKEKAIVFSNEQAANYGIKKARQPVVATADRGTAALKR